MLKMVPQSFWFVDVFWWCDGGFIHLVPFFPSLFDSLFMVDIPQKFLILVGACQTLGLLPLLLKITLFKCGKWFVLNLFICFCFVYFCFSDL